MFSPTERPFRFFFRWDLSESRASLHGEAGDSLGEPGTVVVVVVVVTVMVLLMAKRSEPFKSWIDGGTTGRPSRQRSTSLRCLSWSPSFFSELLFDLFSLSRSRLVECCPLFFALCFLELEL